MKYEIEIREKADKDLRHIPKDEAKRITAKIINLENGLTGDIKKLTNYDLMELRKAKADKTNRKGRPFRQVAQELGLL